MVTIKGEGIVTVVPVITKRVVTGMRVQIAQPTIQWTRGYLSNANWQDFVADSEGNRPTTGEEFTTDPSGNITGDGPSAFKDVVTLQVSPTSTITFRKQ